MALVTFNQGTELTLAAILNKTAPQDLKCKLFTNNHTPVIGDTEANYTEATFSGYVAASLAGAGWTITTANPSVASFAAQTFTSNANQVAQTVYGYYLVQTTSGKALAAELLTNPVVIQSNTDSITVTPNYSAQSL